MSIPQMNPMNWLALLLGFNLFMLTLMSKVHFFNILSLSKISEKGVSSFSPMKIFF